MTSVRKNEWSMVQNALSHIESEQQRVAELSDHPHALPALQDAMKTTLDKIHAGVMELNTALGVGARAAL